METAENTSGQGASAAIPAEIKGWNWGAFLMGWIWAIGNKVWIGLLSLIPYVGFIMAIILGVKGNEWAWQNRSWESIEQFRKVQKTWALWGIGVFVASIVLPVMLGAAIMSAVKHSARQAQPANTVQSMPAGTPGMRGAPPAGPGMPGTAPGQASGAPGILSAPAGPTGAGAVPSVAPEPAPDPKHLIFTHVAPRGIRVVNEKNWDHTTTQLLRFKYKTPQGDVITVVLPSVYKAETMSRDAWDTLFQAFAMDREERMDAQQGIAEMETLSPQEVLRLMAEFAGQDLPAATPNPAAPAMDFARRNLPGAAAGPMPLPPMLPGMP